MIQRRSFGSSPYISVVVPTIPRNSHENVLNCLKNQETQEDYEIVIVNDSELDICEARNKGIDEAKGDIVALTDDDCVPPSDWIKRIEKSYKSNKNVACIEGAVSGGINYNGTRHYVGCNLSFSREEALKIGGFRSEYAGYRDDTEFGWRMEEESDLACIFDPAIQMNHPARPRSGYIEELDDKLKSEYPDRYQEILLGNLIQRSYLSLTKLGIVPKFNQVWNSIYRRF